MKVSVVLELPIPPGSGRGAVRTGVGQGSRTAHGIAAVVSQDTLNNSTITPNRLTLGAGEGSSYLQNGHTEILNLCIW